jgi:UDP-GlcNAc3NAcA epimerase
MSSVFFQELDLPEPNYNLGINGGTHGQMTGRMLERLEGVLVHEKPDWLLIYGDTNSTLAGALASVKLHIPIAHVEAGLRSFNMHMPEEVNRILSDRLSSLLFCPTVTAVNNLKAEGIVHGVHNVGDVMYDAALYYQDIARSRSTILDDLGVNEGEYVLATCHRAENTDDPVSLRGIAIGLAHLAEAQPVVMPLHPRTYRLAKEHGLLTSFGNVKLLDPVAFLDMLRLEASARLIVTDSGGVQKEAYFFNVPCITLREETEWIETIESGWNRLVGADSDSLIAAAENITIPMAHPGTYGDGRAAYRILDILLGQL